MARDSKNPGFMLHKSAVRKAREMGLTDDDYTVEEFTQGGKKWYRIKVKEGVETPAEKKVNEAVGEVKESMAPQMPAPTTTEPEKKQLAVVDEAENDFFCSQCGRVFKQNDPNRPPDGTDVCLECRAKNEEAKKVELPPEQAVVRSATSGTGMPVQGNLKRTPRTSKAPREYVHKSTVEGPTKLVWSITEELRAKNPNISRKAVIEECVKRGIAFYTARTQYQTWLTAKRESDANAAKVNGKK